MSEKIPQPVKKETEGLVEGGSVKKPRRKAPKLSDVEMDVKKKSSKAIKSFSDLPEEFVKAIEEVAAKKEVQEQNQEVELELDEMPEPSETWTRPEKGIRGGSPSRVGTGSDFQSKMANALKEAADEDVRRKERRKADFENRKATRENVSRRVGGKDFQSRAAEAIKKAEEEDKNRHELEGMVLPPLSKEDLGSFVEDDSKKLRKEDVQQVKSFDELLELINHTDGVYGSKEYFEADKLKMIIEMVRNKETYDGQEIGIEYVTRSAGLRDKVAELLGYKNEEESVVEVPKAPKISRKPKQDEIKEEELITKPAEKPKPEDFKIVNNNPPAEFSIKSKGGVEFEETERKSEYSPEQFAKDDPDVLKVPGGISEFNPDELPDLNNLPEVPLEPISDDEIRERARQREEEHELFRNSDVGKEYEKELSDLEHRLKTERAKFLLAEQDLENKTNEKKTPLGKFKFRLSKKKKDAFEMSEKNREEARKSYEQAFRDLVKQSSLMHTDLILSYRANSPSRKIYEAASKSQIKNILNEVEGLNEYINSLPNYGTFVKFSDISNFLKEKGMTKKQIDEYHSRFVYAQVSQTENKIRGEEEERMMSALLKK